MHSSVASAIEFAVTILKVNFPRLTYSMLLLNIHHKFVVNFVIEL